MQPVHDFKRQWLDSTRSAAAWLCMNDKESRKKASSPSPFSYRGSERGMARECSPECLNKSNSERHEKYKVKASMSTKFSFIGLLSALCLLASGYSGFGSCNDCAPASQDRAAAFESAKHCSLSSFFSSDLSARRFSSRNGQQIGKSDVPLVESAWSSHIVERDIAILCPRLDGPLSLISSWQFACRAALDPRAPSSRS